jgi:hypothetical protein
MEKFIAAKMAKIGDRWERISLTKEEINQALDELVKFNFKELSRIMEMVRSYSIGIDKEEATKILFERQGISSFTYLNNVLDDKIDRLKSRSYKPPEAKKAEEETKKDEELAEDEEADMVMEEEEESENPMEAGKLEGEKDEYEEIKMPKEKKGRFF